MEQEANRSLVVVELLFSWDNEQERERERRIALVRSLYITTRTYIYVHATYDACTKDGGIVRTDDERF